jgi:hypothetical protein
MYIKGKAIPLQAWTGPEGSRRLRLADFKLKNLFRIFFNQCRIISEW